MAHEDLLYEKTFKGQCETIEERIYYTLDGGVGGSFEDCKTNNNLFVKSHKTIKALALMAKLLIDKGIVSEEELDELLLNATH